MLTTEQNEFLTRTDRGTPMGEYLRRFWTPVLLASELPEPDCPPVKVRVFGEHLIAFRDTNDQLGLLDEYCPHRRASLYWGRNEECGLRCVYHGWKFDVAGHCVDMPNEPAESNFKDKIRLRSYPARSWGGLIWAYLGPIETMPGLPEFEWALVPPSHRFVSKRVQESNYLQALEGGIDSSHVSFLHSRPNAERELAEALGLDSYMWRDKAPRFTVNPTDHGLVIGARRNTDDDRYYWRITQYLLPTATMIPAALDPEKPLNGHVWVPIDDDNCWNFSITWQADRPLNERELMDVQSPISIHAGVDPVTFRPVRNRDNDYLIDREMQRAESFTGIVGVSEQDAAVQESMGAIVDRSQERLGTSDAAVIAARRLLLQQARDLQAGRLPFAPQNPRVYRVRSASVVLDKDVPFEEGAKEDLKARVREVPAAT